MTISRVMPYLHPGAEACTNATATNYLGRTAYAISDLICTGSLRTMQLGPPLFGNLPCR